MNACPDSVAWFAGLFSWDLTFMSLRLHSTTETQIMRFELKCMGCHKCSLHLRYDAYLDNNLRETNLWRCSPVAVKEPKCTIYQSILRATQIFKSCIFFPSHVLNLKLGGPNAGHILPTQNFLFTTVTSFVKLLIKNRTSANLNDTFEKVVHL